MRRIGWPADPLEAERPVGMLLPGHAHVEQQRPVRRELRSQRLAAPTEQDVAVRQQLHVPLAAGRDLVRVEIFAHNRGRHFVRVEREH